MGTGHTYASFDGLLVLRRTDFMDTSTITGLFEVAI